MKRRSTLAAAAAALAAASAGLPGLATATRPVARAPQPYRWKSVQIVGGGFVSGFVFHPTAPGVLYARTDMGGAYRRDPGTGRWQPLLDWVSHDDSNLMGVESLALDPSDPQRLYIAAGTYTAAEVPDGALLRSADGGHRFERTALPFKLGGNENGRGNGERLAVDPNDGRVLFLGTRNDGLWVSRDRGASFARAIGFPAVARLGGSAAAGPGGWSGDGRDGIVFVLFDPNSSTAGQASRTLYAGVSVLGRPGLYRSDDGGLSWRALPGQPTAHRPNHGVLAADGMLYVSYGSDPGPSKMTGGAVWRHDTRTGAWREITPDRPTDERRFGYAAVAVDARDPRRLIASSFGRPGGEELFRSTDGGASWRPVFGAGAVFDHGHAPYTRDTHLHWLFDIEIDPADPDHAMFTTGYGGWETHDLSNADAGRPTHWKLLSPGIEETVALALHSPTRGVPLVSAIGDYSGFVHHDLEVPAAGNPKPPFFGNTHDVAGAELKPEVIVRVGKPRDGGTGLGYSLDGGGTWRQPASVPVAGAAAGHLAVSADGTTWVWAPQGQPPHVTTDRGATWRICRGLGRDLRVVADRVNPRRFYAIDLFDRQFFESTDGAASFQASELVLPGPAPVRRSGGAHNATDRGDDRGGQDRLYATPGTEGDVWLAAHDGLYHGAAGRRLRRLPGVDRMMAFGFGRAERDGGHPALYMAGVVNGQPGIHRSTDAAASWVRINDDAHQWGLVLQVAGDPKTFGRVYVGTHGRGILYGEPAPAR
ncbi:MAG: WD40/YVTN/BNR-like repeat-containing protein [Pseudomonadota bacterium]